MAFSKKHIGNESEKLACHFLESKGMKLIAQNYSCYRGEIDLIMQDGDDIVFVEVRSRSRIDFGSACESINKTKMKKLILTAQFFLQQKNWLHTINSRFDIIAIHRIASGTEIEWIKHAFSAEI